MDIEDNNSKIIKIDLKQITNTNTYNKNKQPPMTEKNKNKDPKKLVNSVNWTFSADCFEYQNQLNMVYDISNNYINKEKGYEGADVCKIAIQQIHKKISGYKGQDAIKKHLDTDKFLTFESIIQKMIECELKCRYCKNPMNVLYDISREMTQWSVDRINNNLGHNIDNYHLACLECNLKRRRRTDEKFLFTKQLNIVKMDK